MPEVSERAGVLALEDGAVFRGRAFGSLAALAGGRRCGEVVFATSMTGYQEICTDPSYRGQMVVLTFPLIGNYGIAAGSGESWRPWVSALIVREVCNEPSHWESALSLDAYLRRAGIPGLCEVDTRALTRHLRQRGTLRGVLRRLPPGRWEETPAERSHWVAEARAVRGVSQLNAVAEVVSQANVVALAPSQVTPQARRPRVLLLDAGAKQSIAQCLEGCGLAVVRLPALPVPALDVVRALAPDGVLVSNGPGDPEALAPLVTLVRVLVWEQRLPLMPFMGVCLGHQLLALAGGGHTRRLRYGHHGSNHPVLERATGRVSLTTHNHTFEVDATSLPAASGLRVSHTNLSDGSVEGLAHAELPVFSVQYHPEGAPGPEENHELFERFARLVRAYAARGGADPCQEDRRELPTYGSGATLAG